MSKNDNPEFDFNLMKIIKKTLSWMEKFKGINLKFWLFNFITLHKLKCFQESLEICKFDRKKFYFTLN